MVVRDRITQQLAPRVKFVLEMDQYHRGYAQSPTAYFEQELSTDSKGVIQYTVTPDAAAGSELWLQFSATPSIYLDGQVYVDPDKTTFPQYEKENLSMTASLTVLPSIAGLFR
jgi:hypothetical protein